LTTHYEEIKKFAYRNEQIMLSAVGFDRENLVPTYRYYENTLGESNALKIAGRYLQDPALLERAEYYLESNRSEEEKALSEIKQDLAAAKENEERTAALLKEAEETKQKYEEELRRYQESEEERKREAKEELDAYLETKKEEAQQLIEEIRKSEMHSDQLKKKTAQFDKINTIQVKENKEPIRVGDRVRIGDGERVGTVLSLEKGRAKVDLKGLSIDVKEKELTRLPPLPKKKTYTERSMKKRVSGELNLVGMRVEEALQLLEKYLDDAFGSKRSNVKIIHGIGTMALRNACRNYLKKCSFVKAYHDGDYYDGGGAVTIVEFVNGS
ncbi:MAG: Smr/MutS family protein, partial [Erysipelotrichaceae bacterium]|nr:Smr/MutS family protein [Erysipelotrichaceae bacterium]